MIRRSCFEDVGLYDTGLRVSEDVDMWIRLASRFSVGHIAEPLAKVRFHTQNITTTTGVGVVQSAHTAVLESVFKDKELGPIYSHLRKRAYFGLYCLCSRVAARTGHPVTALSYSWKAVKTWPGTLFSITGLSLMARSANEFLPRWLRRIVIRVMMVLRFR